MNPGESVTTEMAAALVRGDRRGELTFTILYDEHCPLCRRLKEWLAGQRQLAQIEFVAANSTDARRRFPELDHIRSITVLTVVSSDGFVYEGERAWLVCTWTLPAWRPAAEHFSTPVGRRVVRVAARVIDGYRHRGMSHDQFECCTLAANEQPQRPW